jgi:cytochrome c
MLKSRITLLNITLLLSALSGIFFTSCKQENPRILIFSKTEGYRHTDAINAGYEVLFKNAAQKGFIIDSTEEAMAFNEENLKRYRAIIFLDVSGALFNHEQRTSFKRFIQAGGGFLATHASTDAERDWPWYNRLIGAYFYSHSAVQKATYMKVNTDFEASRFLPDTFSHVDEHYNFMKVDSAINVLVALDEKTYEGGNMGTVHPIVWYHEFDGGRSYYNGMGHTKETWSDSLYLQQFWTALKWVAGGENPKPLDYTKAMPEENRFNTTVLAEKLDEPMQMAIAQDGRVFFAERRGNVQVYDPKIKAVKTAGTVPVLAKYEDGLLGIALDPLFDKNNWIYLFYAEPGLSDTTSNYHISRFSLNNAGRLDLASEKILIKIPHQNTDGIHTGGALMFDPRGTGDLFITVGDNTSPRATPYAPIDERPGRELFNAQRSASNTNDLRGKILRIHPESDGTYSVPEGNLFAKGMKNTRPEIYSMGHRQPWRLSMDTKTGWLYEGEVGPDSRVDSFGRGPASVDEFNQIRKPGNYGWPYFVGDNKAYWNYDFANNQSGEKFDTAKPRNHSRLNTGITDLPPAQPALVWYPYAESDKFPEMGTGARSAVGGPIFRKQDYPHASGTFPEYYEGKWFITEWIRNWILVVTMDEEGRYKSMERFLPDVNFAGPMDMQFGPDGSLYVLEYGKGWFKANDDAKLVRIAFNGGNRNPVANADADHLAGALPLKVNLSSAGSRDYDGDELKYEWKITSAAGFSKVIAEPNPAVTLDKAAVYTATLTVSDQKGGSSSKSIAIKAGNAAPVVQLAIRSNKTFFFPNSAIDYVVSVADKEDGTTSDGSIAAKKVNVSIDYVAGGYSPILGDPVPGQFETMDFRILIGGMKLNASDCYSCHSISKKSIGPTFKEVAEKYKNDSTASNRLIKKVINGGGGVWGQAAMSAHPDLTPENAKPMVDFILSLSEPAQQSRPLEGSFKTVEKAEPKGVYLVKASYTDAGAEGVPPVTGENTVVLRNPVMFLSSANTRKGSMNIKVPSTGGQVELMVNSGDYIGFEKIDMAGIDQLEISGSGTGTVEIHLDTPTGPTIGQFVPDPKPASVTDAANPLANARPYKAKLSDVEGVHDVYLVLNGSLFMMKDTITFVSGK